MVTGTALELQTRDADQKSPWFIVLGAAGSVGQFAVQVRISIRTSHIML